MMMNDTLAQLCDLNRAGPAAGVEK